MKITRLTIANKGTGFEFYVGDAISTRGVHYRFLNRDEIYGAMREEIRGTLQIGTPVTPSPALKSAIRSAVRNVASTTSARDGFVSIAE
jgi:hypothetical protein